MRGKDEERGVFQAWHLCMFWLQRVGTRSLRRRVRSEKRGVRSVSVRVSVSVSEVESESVRVRVRMSE